MTTLNIYSVPKNTDESASQYIARVSAMTYSFNSEKQLSVDVAAAEVKLDGTLSGGTILRTEEELPPEEV